MINKPLQEEYRVSITRSLETQRVTEEIWRNMEGQMHRKHGPAHQVFSEDGIKLKEVFYSLGEIHRWNPVGDVDPARCEWDKNGRLLSAEFFRWGKRHRNDRKPAIIHYDPETGEVTQQQFYQNSYEINPKTGREINPETGREYPKRRKDSSGPAL